MSEMIPSLNFREFDANGAVLAGGQLFTYAAGTSTPLATYTDATELTPNANPVILDATGRAQVWLGNNAYKFVLKDAANNILYTVDNVRSIEALISSFTTTTTALATTTLTNQSTAIQYFLGTLTQTVKLPTTGIANGQQFIVFNRSTGNITVQASDGSAVQVMVSGSQLFVTANKATPVVAADWTSTYIGTSSTAALYTTILGQPSDVISGAANYSTWATAMAAINDNNNMLVLQGTITENVTISKKLNIIGEGHGTVLSGTLTFASGSDYSLVKNLKVTGNIVINSGVNVVQLLDFWTVSSASITDNGTGSLIQGVQE